MMIKVNNIFLDFDGEVEMERQVKLFEEIDATAGDFSYQFTLPLTAKNIEALSRPFPDNISKRVYNTVASELCGDDGITIYRGSIRVESITDVINCSFFSGNANWFAMITGNMTDLDLSQYDVEQNRANIVASYSNDDGIIFPLIDTGILSTRSYPSAKVEDFTPAFYVRTLFRQVFQQAGLKISGGFLNDYLFNKTIILSNGRSNKQIEERSSYVEKTIQQTLPSPGIFVKVSFDNDSVYPFFDGSANNYDTTLSRYTADQPIILKISFTINYTVIGYVGFYIYLNGVQIKLQLFGGNVLSGSMNYSVRLSPGDYIEVYSAAAPLSTGTLDSGTIRFTPNYVYKVLGSYAVPFWTKQQFVSNILRMFNVITSFDDVTKTVQLETFDTIKSKPSLDLSQYFTTTQVDYQELVSDYARKNIFKYQDNDTENLREYNITSFVKYGEGVIVCDNDFVEESVVVVESDFSTPVSYENQVFGVSIERINFVEGEDNDETTFASVSDSSGVAQFNVADDIFLQGDLVRVEESTEPAYNGEFIVSNVGSGTIRLRGLDYLSNSSGKIMRITHKVTTSDDVYIMVSVGNYPYANYSNRSGFYIENTFGTTVAPAYFSLLALGRQIEQEYVQSLSFGRIADPLFFQRTLLEVYWVQFGRILNDPVKLIGTGYYPLTVYKDIDFLRPIAIKTLETTNLYYCNRLTGYKGQHLECETELIKLP